MIKHWDDRRPLWDVYYIKGNGYKAKKAGTYRPPHAEFVGRIEASDTRGAVTNALQFLKAKGIEFHKRAWDSSMTPARNYNRRTPSTAVMLEMIYSGLSIATIASLYSVSPVTIYGHLWRRGLNAKGEKR